MTLICKQGDTLQSVQYVTHHLSDPALVLDCECKIIHANRAAEALYGYSTHELPGRPLDALIADPGAKHVQAEILQTVLSGKSWGGLHSSKKKDGSTFMCKHSLFPLIDSNGQISSSVCILSDITDEKIAQNALLETVERLNLALKGSNLGLWDWYPQKGELSMNDNLASMLGYTLDELPRDVNSFNDLIRMNGQGVGKRVMKAHLEGQPYACEAECLVKKKSGEWIWVLDKAKVSERDANGNPVRITGTFQDITERKRAEESLRESQEHLKATFNAIDSGILVVDTAGKVSQVNRKFAEMWRIPQDLLDTRDNERLLGFVLDQIEAPDSFLSGVRELYQGQMEGQHEIRFKDGRIYEQFSCPMVRKGKGIGRIWNIRDITERRQAEERRKKLEAQLVQSQKMEAIGTLAGGIAHDFNNILSAIMGYTELAMVDLVDPEKAANELKEVLKAAGRAKDLVSHILTFSRQNETSYSPLGIEPIIKETIKMIRSIIPTTIEIRQDLADSGLIHSDPTQIHQIMMNLCTNAVDAMGENGGVLEVSLHEVRITGDAEAGYPELPPGPYARLTVRDTGHGIPPEVRYRIFEPYFTTKEKGRGTGLGLSVVHGIVERHGGSITCRSVPGEGSTFEIFLPKIESHVKALQPLEPELPPTGTERILFIDDEPSLVDLEKMAIEGLGYSVVTRTSSVEALELFRNDPYRFDLVITDMTMPGMTGDRLAVSLMKIRPDIPIILCTGYSEHITEEKAKRLGIREFIFKPFLKKKLAETIRKALGEIVR